MAKLNAPSVKPAAPARTPIAALRIAADRQDRVSRRENISTFSPGKGMTAMGGKRTLARPWLTGRKWAYKAGHSL